MNLKTQKPTPKSHLPSVKGVIAWKFEFTLKNQYPKDFQIRRYRQMKEKVFVFFFLHRNWFAWEGERKFFFFLCPFWIIYSISSNFLLVNYNLFRDFLGWAVLLNFLVYITIPVVLQYTGILLGVGSFAIYINTIIGLAKKENFFWEQVNMEIIFSLIETFFFLSPEINLEILFVSLIE